MGVLNYLYQYLYNIYILITSIPDMLSYTISVYFETVINNCTSALNLVIGFGTSINEFGTFTENIFVSLLNGIFDVYIIGVIMTCVSFAFTLRIYSFLKGKTFGFSVFGIGGQITF